jgi:tetratricopeptide (TPR) repeat protein
MADLRYKAFISYSWADAAWGKWLHRAIETYRTPAALVGQDGAFGPVPARLQPVFKDREEEAAGHSISSSVEAALASSEFLIVICSPNSARSQWVDHEIAWFKTHRDPTRILSLIVDGEPGSADAECFPKALTHTVNADLTISANRLDAPLAADARSSGDGKRGARLKLAAAMLGVGLDELVRRDDRRRALRTRIIVGASLALALAMTALAITAVRARNEAEFQRAQSDGLVEFMLTDLRERLEPVGRLDALDVVGQRALYYYAQQQPGNLDANALGRRSRALHLVGEVSNIRGDSAAGLKAFREAAATTAEQLARDPDNAQRIFDHAQSVFWVGYIAYERKETREAEVNWHEYKRLADRLVAIDAKKPEWRLEVSYAENNLGVLLFDQGRYAEADRAFTNAVAKMQSVMATEMPSSARQMELGRLLNWLGKARAGVGRIDDALLQHHREIGLYKAALATDQKNNEARWLMAIAWQQIGQLAITKGRIDEMITANQASLGLTNSLRLTDSGNKEWQETEIRAMNGLTEALTLSGNLTAARTVNQDARQSLRSMLANDPKNKIWSVQLRSNLEAQQARLHLARHEYAPALEVAQTVLDRLEAAEQLDAADFTGSYATASLVAGDALVKLGRRQEAFRVWQGALEKLAPREGDFLYRAKLKQFQLFKRLGDRGSATGIASELERQGVMHPAFTREK